MLFENNAVYVIPFACEVEAGRSATADAKGSDLEINGVPMT